MQHLRSNVCDEILFSLREAITSLSMGGVPAPTITLGKPDDPSRGDFSSNLGFILAKELKRKPIEIAEDIAARFSGPALATAVLPGYINFTIKEERLLRNLEEIGQPCWGENLSGEGIRVNVEYVSANPTGPLHVGHGRGAVLGDAIARLLSVSGFDVTREYYLNDVGKQIDALGRSILHIKAGLEGRPTYGGVAAEEVAAAYSGPMDDIEGAAAFAIEKLFEKILADLKRLDIEFDSVVRESDLKSEIPELIKKYRGRGLLYESDEPEGAETHKRRVESKAALHKDKMAGGTFLRTSRFGDEIDRIILRANGEPTYFTSDIVYHVQKFQRGFDRAINIWGADHGGHVKRMKAALLGLDLPADNLEVVLCQIVRLLRGGTEFKMSKRSGDFVTLTELLDEVGADASRFFFLMRSPNSQLDFDLDLAVKQSADNPVFYCQYAHARTCRLIEKGLEAGIKPALASEGMLVDPIERDILRKLIRIPESVRGAARSLDVHRLPEIAIELAQALHRYQTAGKENDRLRIIMPDQPELSGARLFMIGRVGMALRFLLGLMGVSAPERM